MSREAKKLYLIEEILKMENHAVLAELETVIAKNSNQHIHRRSFKDFGNMMTAEEAAAFGKIIEEGCEEIYSEGWK